MIDIDNDRRRSYVAEMRRVANLLSVAVSDAELDKAHVLRLLGHGMSLLLGVGVEALGGDSTIPTDHPGQLGLFQDNACHNK